MGFALRDDVYYCVANRKVVLLDLRGNTLFCLPPATDMAFQRLAVGEHNDADMAELAPLITRGYLYEVSGSGLTGPKPRPVVPLRDLPASALPPSSLADTASATFRQLATMAELRTRPIHRVLADVRSRKAERSSASDWLADPKALRRLSAMLATRRHIKTQDKCLRWSVAMARHLHAAGAYAELVFGVRMQPFGAHAWVQSGDLVVNDSADHVLQYTPILVI